MTCGMLGLSFVFMLQGNPFFGEEFVLNTKDNGADTSLLEHIPDTSQNADVLDLRSRNIEGTLRHNAVALRFNKTWPASAEAISATLKLCITTADTDSFSIDVYGLIDGTQKNNVSESDWVENVVTYNTMPGFSGADTVMNIDRNHATGETVFLGIIQYVGGTLGEIDFRSNQAFLDFLNADTDGSVTLFLESQIATDGQDFSIYIKSNKNSLMGDQFYPTLAVTAEQNEHISIATREDGADTTLAEHIPDSPADADVLDLRSRNIEGTLRHNAVALRFNVPFACRANATEASLALDVTTADSDSFSIDVYGLADGPGDTHWVENTVTYNTMPGFSGADAVMNIDRDHVAGETIYLGTINYVGGTSGQIIFPSSASLVNFLNSDANGAVTFLLEAQTALVDQDFHIYIKSNKTSLQSGQFYPTLDIDYTTPIGSMPWPSIVDETTGRRVYQLTSRPGNNMAFYYLFKNEGAVNGVPYLAYRSSNSSGVTYYSINLNTGKELMLAPRGMVGSITDVVGEYLYCMKKANFADPVYSYLVRYHLKTGAEETVINLDTQYTHSANLSVSADGQKVLFFHPAADGDGVQLLCGEVGNGTIHEVASGNMSHIQFGPVDPDLYIYINENYDRDWKRTGFGWVDLAGGFVTNTSMNVNDSFFNESNGQLIPSHLHYNADGFPAITAVDTQKPYVKEYNVVVSPDRKNPGKLLSYKKVQIKMGEFQSHFNPGPTAEWYVGDGKSADWWHKPGFGKPYIHKIRYNYKMESMIQTPLADQIGCYWKSGEYEACTRYIPGKNLVVWNSFRTLEGRTPDFLTDEQIKTGDWEESSESWLYSSANDVPQNVFAVSYSGEDSSGWDFVESTEGWSLNNGTVVWSFGGDDQTHIEFDLNEVDERLVSPDNINLSCDDYSGLMIRLKNSSAATRCRFYFTTDTSETFAEDKRINLEGIDTNMSDYKSYFVDFSSHPEWKGLLKQMRVCPTGVTSGSFSIQVIRFL